MTSYGLRVLDKENRVVSVMLKDLLNVIPDHSLKWRILFSDVVFRRDVTDRVVEIQKRIEKSDDGILVTWEELEQFASQVHQEIDLDLLGSKDSSRLHRYATDWEMYHSCEVVIRAIDTSYWEVHTTDKRLVESVKKCFKKVEEIDSQEKMSDYI